MEVVIRCADGSSRTVVAHAAELGEDMAGTHLVVLYDATKERRLAEEQRALEAQLVQAQRLESVGRLAGGIAHDFNNTLAVILGRTEIALKRPLDEDMHAHLLEIRDAAQSSAELIRQLLAYAKRQPVMPHVIDPNEAVETSLRILRLLVGDTVRLKWIPADDVWLVEIDPGQFVQILTNLCSNARDSVAHGGEVTIRVQNVSVTDDRTTASGRVLSAGDYAVLSVEDDGAGVAPEIADRIFEPFFTTKTADDRPGHGLGLSTVYGIARQNGGGVIVEAAPGGGAVFKVLLRRHR
jgi:signal transduction histidine kinase